MEKEDVLLERLKEVQHDETVQARLNGMAPTTLPATGVKEYFEKVPQIYRGPLDICSSTRTRARVTGTSEMSSVRRTRERPSGLKRCSHQ